jgi:V/A-type H+-transporting ATPase subunit I
MFFPKEMTEIELVVPSKDLLAVTKILSRRGIFHQTDSNYPGVDSGSASTWQDNAAAYAALERRIQSILQTLNVDEGQPSSAEIDSTVEMEVITTEVDEIENEVKSVGDELTERKKQLEVLENDLNQLEPIADVETDLNSLRGSGYLFSTLGLIPTANVDRLKTSLSRVPHVFLILKSDSQRSVVWLSGSRNNADVLDRAAKSAYLNPLTLPDEYTGTPAEIIKSITTSMEETEQRIAQLNEELAKLAESRKDSLRELYWEVHASRVVADSIVRFGQLKHTYVIVGWVPTRDLETLEERLRFASKEILIQTLPTTRIGHNPHVPIALTTNKWLRPIQNLVTTYGRPHYGELDPTLLMALSFPFLYGAMFGDLGQGLVLMLVGYLAHNRIFMKGLQSLGLLLVYCGASAAIFGFLYGSIFGFEGHLVEEYLHFHFEPLWFSPLHNILGILSIAIDVGILLLLFGFLLGLFNQIRSRDWAHFFFGHTGLVALAFYISFLALLGGFLADTAIAPRVAVAISNLPLPFPWLALIFGIGIMLSGFLRNLVEGHRPLIEGSGIGGFIMFLVQSFMDIFETVISMLSNTLSFVRVGAFAVAHGGLSLAIFSLAGEEPTVGFWIVIILGNIFIIGFEGLIVYIQTMRLHYYEILGKFFTGGGMRFEPLTLTSANEEG